MIFNKLVRDRIPEIIRADGFTPTTRVLAQQEYCTALSEKIVEEVRELALADTQAKMIEECADVLETLDAFMLAHGIDPATVSDARASKRIERGAFEKKIYLVSIEK